MSPTRYTVVATDEATDELTTLWLNNPSQRRAITNASHALEAALRNDADQKGIPAQSAAHPSLCAPDHEPLRVLFEVSELDRLVRLLGFELLTSAP